jgi:L-alanine-DL-glutamate epimerase-like enolase superfamily enzyme
MDLHVAGIDRFSIKVPFRELPGRAMTRNAPHWDIFEICKVTLHNGLVGYGETMSFYTCCSTEDRDVKRAWGKNAAEIMWDDSLGTGLQMALFDAVAKSAGVPIHSLLGRQVRKRAHVSWWGYDLPPDDLAAECRRAVAHGYTNFKTKARPWWDLHDQLSAASKVVPESFKIGIDFNGTLLGAEHAERILPDLERKFPILDIIETPIPQEDVAGGKRVQAATKTRIAHHYGSPPVTVQLKENLCDGFVVSSGPKYGGGLSKNMQQAAVCATAGKPLWLQHVGTGLTAAFSLHVAAVLPAAKWAAVNCHQLFRDDLLKPTFTVKNGTAAIPEKPGLGFDLDTDALEAFRIETPKEKPFGPDRLLRVAYPEGQTWYYAHGRQCYEHAMTGTLPVFPRGVRLETVPNDASDRWRKLHRQALKGPVREP